MDHPYRAKIRLDQATLAETLSSSIQVLYQEGYIQERDLHDIRIFLSDLSSVQDFSSFLDHLFQENSSLSSALTAFYGRSHFCIHLIKKIWSLTLEDYQSKFPVWVKDLESLWKSHFTLNLIPTSGYAEPLGVLPLSFFFGEYLSLLRDQEKALVFFQTKSLQILDLRPGGKEHTVLGERLCKTVGSTHKVHTIYPEIRFKSAWAQWVSTFKPLIDHLEHTVSTLGGESKALTYALSKVRLVLTQLQTFEGTSSSAWFSFLASSSTLGSSFLETYDQLIQETLGFWRNHCLKSQSPHLPFSAIGQEEALLSMMKQGIPILSAQKALQSLASYLKEKRITPERLLPGEWPRVNPCLKSELLNRFGPCDHSWTTIEDVGGAPHRQPIESQKESL